MKRTFSGLQLERLATGAWVYRISNSRDILFIKDVNDWFAYFRIVPKTGKYMEGKEIKSRFYARSEKLVNCVEQAITRYIGED